MAARSIREKIMDATAGVTAQQIAAAAIAVAVLIVSPDDALAKGGGSGSSSSSSSSSSYSVREPPLPDRWRYVPGTYKGTPTKKPFYCVGMPNVGEEIEVLVSPYDRYTPPVYAKARVDKVDSSGSCAFEAFQAGQPASLVSRYYGTDIFFPLVFAGGVVAFFGLAYASSRAEEQAAADEAGVTLEEWRKQKAAEKKEQEERAAAAGVPLAYFLYSEETIAQGEAMRAMKKKPPEKEPLSVLVSGEYTGDTSESDGAAQGSFTKLNFRDDGSVTGSGFDSEDGKFTIVDGYWFGDKAVWFESYPAGPKPNLDASMAAFKVAVRAKLLAGTRIKGEFYSSLCIKGDFTLRPTTQQ